MGRENIDGRARGGSGLGLTGCQDGQGGRENGPGGARSWPAGVEAGRESRGADAPGTDQGAGVRRAFRNMAAGLTGILRGQGWEAGGPGELRRGPFLVDVQTAAGQAAEVAEARTGYTVARLAAAADDAEELAAAMGRDAVMAAESVGMIPEAAGAHAEHWRALAAGQAVRAGLYARLAWRCACQAAALRDLAEDLGRPDALAEAACKRCAVRQAETADGLCWRCAAVVHLAGGAR